MTNFEKPLRILHVVSSLNMGGAEQFVVDISRAMNSQKTVAAILSFGDAGDMLVDRCARYGIDVHHIVNNSRIMKFLQLRRLLKIFNVVHIHSSHCLASILFSTLLMPQTRLFYTRHNSVVHKTIKWKFIYWLASFRLDKIVFIAEMAKNSFLKDYPAFRDKSILIYNGIQPIVLQRSNSSVIRLGQVGRFVPLKAQHLLLHALTYLPEAQRCCFAVHFFGDGPLLEECRKLAMPLRQDISIVFHGLEMDKTAIYQNIDVLVVTSETEGLSLVILEALSAGCLVIATDVGGNSEIIEHEKSGLLYGFPDSLELSNYLGKLTQSYNWHALALAGKHRFHRIFEQEKCVKCYLELYI